MSLFAQMEKNAQFQAELQRYEEQADFLYRKQRFERIDSFTDQYEFLAIEYPSSIYFQGRLYSSVYAAFQAARTEDRDMRERILQAQSVQEIYQIAQHIDDPPGWSKLRLKIMEILLRDKFRRNIDLKDSLLGTNNYQLINSYPHATSSNLYWGVAEGRGQNQLGRLLEQIRTDIRAQVDLDKWLLMTFPVEQDIYLAPEISLRIQKENEQLDPIKFPKGTYFYIGQNNQRNHVVLAHPSISRKHAAIFVNDKLDTCLIDLGSKGGTYLNDQFIEPHLPVVLAIDDKIRFASSTRIYIVELKFEECKINLESRIQKLEVQLKNLSTFKNRKPLNYLHKPPKEAHNLDTIMVKNLPPNTTQIMLHDTFCKDGRIKDIKIPVDRQTGNTKNVAFIVLQKEYYADKIAQNHKLKPYIIDKQKLKLKLVDQQMMERFQDDLKWGVNEKEEQLRLEQLRLEQERLEQERKEQEQQKQLALKLSQQKAAGVSQKAKQQISLRSSSSSSSSSSSDSSNSSSSSSSSRSRSKSQSRRKNQKKRSQAEQRHKEAEKQRQKEKEKEREKEKEKEKDKERQRDKQGHKERGKDKEKNRSRSRSRSRDRERERNKKHKRDKK